MSKRQPLTEAEWREVFRIRCRSKSGSGITPEELKLCKRALACDGKRYAAMDKDVFEATRPFGSAR